MTVVIITFQETFLSCSVVKIDETDVSIEITRIWSNLIQEINLDPHKMKNTRIGVLEKLFNIRMALVTKTNANE